MDPERIHSYLQAACAGLGFDIGEVWFSAVDNNNCSKLATSEHRIGRETQNVEPKRSITFLQLYASKSYGDPEGLIRPELEDDEENSEAKQHVLSPTLVHAIATNAQVVWANCQRQEGVLGKTHMRLQTAVGMPVAMDCYGNMCIVVMFSLKHVKSTKDAMAYIKLISQGAASSKISCLLPVIDGGQAQLAYDPKKFRDWQRNRAYMQQIEAQRSVLSGMDRNELSHLPKDRYGIPILPEFAELSTDDNISKFSYKRLSFLGENGESSDDFDNSTFGLWSTIMNGPTTKRSDSLQQRIDSNVQPQLNYLDTKRRVRLEEFLSAFLGFSLFDIADVWAPMHDTNGIMSLQNVFAAISDQADTIPSIALFQKISKNMSIQSWSGPAGQAYCSGKPVWSSNLESIVDVERRNAFNSAKISTVLSLPIFSNDTSVPSCIICFYSLVRTDASIFVVNFLQQALRTIWGGIDAIIPHESIATDQLQGISAADIAGVTADVELQRGFDSRKRVNDLIAETSSSEGRAAKRTQRSSSFFEQLQSLNRESPNITASAQAARRAQAPYSFLEHLQYLNGESRNTHGDDTAKREQRSSSFFEQLQSINGERSQPVKRSQTPPFAQQPQFFEGVDHVAQQVQVQIPSSFSAQPQSLNGEICKQPYNNSNHQPIPISPNGLHALQNLATAAQQLPVQPLGMNPNFVRDGPKSYVNNFSSASSFQYNVLQAAPTVENAAFFVDPSPQLCLPSGTSPKQSNTRIVSNTAGKLMPNKQRICRIEGCTEPSLTRRPYCTQHTGNRICEYGGGCKKCAQGATRFCIAHGGGRRCTFPGCDKGARDKFFCAAHGGGKRCKYEGCNKSAVGGSKLCTSHGGGRRCSVEGCEKSAQSSTKYCVKHGGGKTCAHGGCTKVARGRTLYCAGHGGGVRCKLDGCNRIAIGKLQLCRAHGGGTSKGNLKKKQSQQQVIDPEGNRLMQLF